MSTTKQHKQYSGNKKSRWINMKKSKSHRVFFTANKDECLSIFPNTYVFGTVMTYKGAKGCDTSPSMSGVVIIMMGVVRRNTNEIFWSEEIHDKAKSCKTNTLRSYSHHGTEGYVNYFGNKPYYGI